MKINLVNNKLLSLYSIDLIGLNNCIYRIKKIKKLDIYKGKGVLLQGEKIIKKEGKKATF
jgi:ribosomal protein L6P/L9E